MNMQSSPALFRLRPLVAALAACGGLSAAACADDAITGSSRSIIELRLPDGERPPSTDDGPDPSPELLDPTSTAAMRELAARLSRERAWLTPAVLEALSRRSVDLPEVFADAAHEVSVAGRRHVVQLDALGRWDHFDAAADPFAVALSAEIATPVADDQVVASVAGEDRVLAEADLARLPVIFVTLAAPAAGSAPAEAPAVATGLAASAVRLAPELPRDLAARTALAARRRAACTPIEPSCELGQLECPADTEPFFVATEIRVNDEHEPWLRGAPEIEAFVVRMDESPSDGGQSGEASTTAMFDGALHPDARGRTRLLPDVNRAAAWYPIDDGFALFPYGLGDTWAVTGVEDDNVKGVWRARGEAINWIALFETVFSAVSAYQELQYLELLQDLLSLFDMIRDAVDTDDMLQPAIGIDRALFDEEVCGGATAWDTIYSLGDDSGDLAVRGHFACLPPGERCP